MADLTAKTPCAGLLPLDMAGISLQEVTPAALTSVAPFHGQAKAVSAALKKAVGAGLPATGRREGAVTWFGDGLYLVTGQVSLDGAAITDQSDAWAVVEIAGPGVEDVLARLIPIDLRASDFAEGAVARTMLAHLSVAIIRSGPRAFEIMVMRSMAATLVHDLKTAMQGVAARAK